MAITASCHNTTSPPSAGIGHIPVQKLRPEDLDTLYARLLTEGKRNGEGGGLSAQSVRNVHITIQGALSDAERKGTVVRNVADLADAPTTSRNSRTMSVWTSDELRAFLDAISDHYLYPLYLLSATTGMRRAESAGLVWRNLDLDTARLTVSRQLLSVEYKLIESALKTPTSRRTIDLDPHTVNQLRLHRRRQLEDRMATGRRHKGGYVFAKPDGSPIHPDLIIQTFERLLAKIDLPRIRLHDLRHTHATILVKGEPSCRAIIRWSARPVSQSAPTLETVRTVSAEKHNEVRHSVKALRPFQPALADLPSLATLRASLLSAIDSDEVHRMPSRRSPISGTRL